MKEKIIELTEKDIKDIQGGSRIGRYLAGGAVTGAYSFGSAGLALFGPAGAIGLGTAGFVYGMAGGGLGYLVDRKISGRR